MKTSGSIMALALGVGAWLAGGGTAWSFYNPSTGRWLNRDPLEEGGAQNPYMFTENQPHNRFDIQGLCSSSMCCLNAAFVSIDQHLLGIYQKKNGNLRCPFHVVLMFAPDGTSRNGKSCSMSACSYTQGVRGHYIVDNTDVGLDKSGAGLPVNNISFVDDGYSLADNQTTNPYFFQAFDNPGTFVLIGPPDTLNFNLTFQIRLKDTSSRQYILDRLVSFSYRAPPYKPYQFIPKGFDP
jgi:hypothetical protein